MHLATTLFSHYPLTQPFHAYTLFYLVLMRENFFAHMILNVLHP